MLFTFFDNVCCSLSSQTHNFRDKYLKESKATSSFRIDSSVLTSSRASTAATLCKNIFSCIPKKTNDKNEVHGSERISD